MQPNNKQPSKLLETLEAELLAMSDADLLEGRDVVALRARAGSRLSDALAEAGRRRLEAARAAVKERRPLTDAFKADADTARQMLRQAANDERYTLAARGFEDMSDEDAIRLFGQLLELGFQPKPDA